MLRSKSDTPCAINLLGILATGAGSSARSKIHGQIIAVSIEDFLLRASNNRYIDKTTIGKRVAANKQERHEVELPVTYCNRRVQCPGASVPNERNKSTTGLTNQVLLGTYCTICECSGESSCDAKMALGAACRFLSHHTFTL